MLLAGGSVAAASGIRILEIEASGVASRVVYNRRKLRVTSPLRLWFAMPAQLRPHSVSAPGTRAGPAPAATSGQIGNTEALERSGFGAGIAQDCDAAEFDVGAGAGTAEQKSPPPTNPVESEVSTAEGQRLGVWVGTVFDAPLFAGGLLSREATTAGALAVAKAHGPAAVLQEGAAFTVVSLVVDSSWDFNRDGVVIGDATTVRTEHPDLYAFTTRDGWPLLADACVVPGSSAGMRQIDPTIAVDADPTAAWREGLGKGLAEVTDDDLIQTFEIALRDVALHAVTLGDQEAHQELGKLGGALKPEDEAHLARAAEAWRQIDQAEAANAAKLNVPTLPPTMPGYALLMLLSVGPPVPFEVVAAVAEDEDRLTTQRHLLASAFPILARIDVDKFLDKPEQRTKSVEDAYLKVIDGCQAARQDLSDDASVLWSIPQIVQAAIDATGLAPDRAAVINDEVTRKARNQMLSELALGAVAFGLTVAGTVATGGLLGPALFAVGVGASVAGAGINAGLVANEWDKATKRGHFSETDIDPNQSLLHPDDVRGDWLWVTVGLIGVVTDIAAVGILVRAMRMGKPLAEAARLAGVAGQTEEIRTALRAQGVSDDLIDATQGLRRGESVAGNGTDAAASTLTRTQAIDRLGVQTTDVPGRSVVVDYVVDAFGGVTSISLRVGAEAAPDMIALHAKVVRQLERYQGLSGRLRSLMERQWKLVPGQPGFEARAELEKLAEAWQMTAKRLAATSFDESTFSSLVDDLDALEEHLLRHQERLNAVSPETGSIAADFPSGARATRPRVDLPSAKRISVDIDHIARGHMVGGNTGNKDLFPEGWTRDQVKRAVLQAYSNSPKRVYTQGPRVLLEGKADGLTIEMWVNVEEKTIETAYPVH